MKTFIITMLAALGLTACTTHKKEEAPEKKVLVVYYSQTGATEKVAKEIQQQLNADIEAIEVENPYDGDFNATIARCQKEMESGEMPTVKPLKANIDDYDIIMIGYPVWFGTYARPIASLIESQKFEGKKVVTFCTFGSGGLQSSTSDLKAALPNAEVIEGYGVRNARINSIKEELNRFLIEGGYKEGDIEALPGFMEHKPVTAEDTEIFNQACGDYQFPLGTPVDVAIRETATSTDYEFSAKSQDKDGKETTATIYVTVGKEANAKPEFTQVVR